MKIMEKTCDCVEMKNQIQMKMRMEYENNKEKYSSYIEFIQKTAENDPLVQEIRKKIGR